MKTLAADERRFAQMVATAAAEAILPTLASVITEATPIDEFLLAVQEANRERNEFIDGELRVAVGLLNAAGITPVLLKGVAYQALGLYPNFGARYLRDIDLLLPASQAETAFQILTEHGFREDMPGRVHSFHHHLPAVRRPGAVHVEIHSRLGGSLTSEVLPAAEVIARAEWCELDGMRVGIPCPEDLVTHLILHSQVQHRYDQRIWPQMRALWDLVMLERKYGSGGADKDAVECAEHGKRSYRSVSSCPNGYPGETSSTLDWDAVAARFRAHGEYGLLALHLMQVRESLGVEVPLLLEVSWLTRMRWVRRQLLRRYPWARFVDPRFVGGILFGTRAEVVRNILGMPEGGRQLLREAFCGEHYRRVWADLTNL